MRECSFVVNGCGTCYHIRSSGYTKQMSQCWHCIAVFYGLLQPDDTRGRTGSRPVWNIISLWKVHRGEFCKMGQVKWQQQKNIAITLVQNTWQDAAINTATIIQSCTYFTQDFCSSVTPRAAVQREGEPGSATTAQLPLSFHVSRSPCVLDYALQRYTSWTRKAKRIFFRTLLLFNLSAQYLFTGRSFTVRCADFAY